MRLLLIALSVAMFAANGSFAARPPGQVDQPGLGEQLGQQLDRGVEELGQQLRQGWAEIRQSVDRLGVQGRVYGRLHWDKALTGATIDIQVEQNSTVVLTGSVPNETAKQKAENLARDTVGVGQVINRLAVVTPTPRPPTPPQPYLPEAGEK